MFFKVLTLPFLLIILMACKPQAHAEGMKEIDARQVYQMINSGDAIIIDNRHASLYENGHIPQALNMTYFKPDSPQNLMTREMLEPFQDKPLIFYCSGALRAYHAAQKAIEWNISADIYWFKGGWPEWQAFTNSPLK
jgi:rhodanese-related sulfurtransferase